MTTLEDVLPEIKRINESIESILADIKSNTGKGFHGQSGNLYEGRTFGKLDSPDKSKDPTVPF